MLEQNIRSVLTAQASITSLIQSRCFPVLLPIDPQLPALTYQIVGSSSGQTQNTHGMLKVRLQIDCWGDTYSDAVTLRDAVANSLDGYQDDNFSALLLSKIDYFEGPALQYRAVIEFYLFTTSV